MKQSPHYVKYWTDKYITALLDAIGAAALLGLETEKRQLFEMSRNAMGLTSPRKRDTMQSGAAKSGKQNGGKTMKKYDVIQYRTMNDGSEMETERFEIDETEIDETREEMENLCGMCIDRYEIREK